MIVKLADGDVTATWTRPLTTIAEYVGMNDSACSKSLSRAARVGSVTASLSQGLEANRIQQRYACNEHSCISNGGSDPFGQRARRVPANRGRDQGCHGKQAGGDPFPMGGYGWLKRGITWLGPEYCDERNQAQCGQAHKRAAVLKRFVDKQLSACD